MKKIYIGQDWMLKDTNPFKPTRCRVTGLKEDKSGKLWVSHKYRDVLPLWLMPNDYSEVERFVRIWEPDE